MARDACVSNPPSLLIVDLCGGGGVVIEPVVVVVDVDVAIVVVVVVVVHSTVDMIDVVYC